jgi:hypothetical protein
MYLAISPKYYVDESPPMCRKYGRPTGLREVVQGLGHPKLAVADNIQSSQPFYNTLHAILNCQFHLNYLFLTVCKFSEGKGDYVA